MPTFINRTLRQVFQAEYIDDNDTEKRWVVSITTGSLPRCGDRVFDESTLRTFRVQDIKDVRLVLNEEKPSKKKKSAFPDIVVDIETLDNKRTAVIASIGALVFDRDATDLIALESVEEVADSRKIYMLVKLGDCRRLGMTVGMGSMMWWMDQDEKAQNELKKARKDGLYLRDALEQLFAFYRKHGPQYPWARSKEFDYGILEHAGALVDLRVPWYFVNVEEVRTAIRMAYGRKNHRVPDMKANNHHALDDCFNQAREIQIATAKIRGDLEQFRGIIPDAAIDG